MTYHPQSTIYKGFTLIELLVVISIIGILSALLATNFVAARSRAYDARAKADLTELKNALHSYYVNYHQYPANGLYAGSPLFKGCGPSGVTACTAGSSFTAGTVQYLSKLPTGYFYYQCSSGDDFRLKVSLNNKSDPDIAQSQLSCPACGTTYNITSDFVVCGSQ
jgi:prepilin-type N-terminal cleavage/methylation domain-containing protein